MKDTNTGLISYASPRHLIKGCSQTAIVFLGLIISLTISAGCSEEPVVPPEDPLDIVFPDSGPPIVGDITGGGTVDDPNQCQGGCPTGQVCSLCIELGTLQCITPKAGQAGAQCVNNAECQSGYCQVTLDSSVNRCAELCDLSQPATCSRAGELCKLSTDVEGRQVALCSLSSCAEDGALCSGQGACQCAEGFQCMDSGAGYNVCRRACPLGECPEGYACEEGMCGALGLKPPGAVCGLNEECESGECAVFDTLAVCLGRCGDCGLCPWLTSGCDRIFTRCNDAGVCAVPDSDEAGGACLASSVCRGIDNPVPDGDDTGGVQERPRDRGDDGRAQFPSPSRSPQQQADGVDVEDATDGADNRNAVDSSDTADTSDASDGADGLEVSDGNDASDTTDVVESVPGVLSCLELSFGSLCGESCSRQSDCASWQMCRPGTTLESAKGLFCQPIADRGLGACCSLQNRCTADASECVLDGSELRCASACTADEECAPEYVCSNVKAAVGTTGRFCVLDPPVLQLETCNGLDDDLDGQVDTDPFGDPLTQPCYEGPGGTLGIGICAAGIQECIEGIWSECKGQKRPVPDGPLTLTGCDDTDNDCDGAIDEGCSCQADPKPCGTELGECSLGLQLCLDGVWSHCEFGQDILPKWPTLERCDGLDNDCDGYVDNTPGQSDYTLKLACGSLPPELNGVGVCVAGERPCEGECTGEVLPVTEVCDDGLDNDCDGAVDEGCTCASDATVMCGTALGACSTGLQSCVGESWSVCEGSDPPQDELCDAVDNDCDGITDNLLGSVAPIGRSCWNLATDSDHLKVGLGQCSPGTQPCLAGDWSTCVGSQLPTPDELCNNGIDDDCDGSTDEGCACEGDAISCGVSTGGCSKGAQVCIEGIRAECENAILPSPEVCNGIDDNCDGVIDNTPAGDLLSVPCYQGPPGTAGFGACSYGTRVCSTGAFAECTGAVLPTSEVCNGLDDDCDGLIDEGLDCGCIQDAPCGAAEGQCEQGIQTCTSGVLSETCVGATYPKLETCNGLDDDCDGTTDMDFEGNLLSAACYSGASLTRGVGTCVSGSRKCSDTGTWTSCIGEVVPSADICGDGLDQDCDGVADEGCPCTAGDSRVCGLSIGQCQEGVQLCADGGWSDTCSNAILPAFDLCDGLDNDCDGTADNGAQDPSQPVSQSCYDGAQSELSAPETTCLPGSQYCWEGSFTGQNCVGQIVPVFDQCGDQINSDCDAEFEEACN